jgi:hypothetical protein
LSLKNRDTAQAAIDNPAEATTEGSTQGTVDGGGGIESTDQELQAVLDSAVKVAKHHRSILDDLGQARDSVETILGLVGQVVEVSFSLHCTCVLSIINCFPFS